MFSRPPSPVPPALATDLRLSKPSPAPVVLIANPAAGRGRGRRLIPAVRAALVARGVHEVHVTRAPGEERAVAEHVTRSGAGTVIALGGDGTWGNVARGILAGGGTSRLALVAAGTGNDLAFVSGIPARDLGAALDVACSPHEQRIDVGEVNGVHFVNCAGFGFDAEVVRAAAGVRWASGQAVYLATALRTLKAYRGIDARVAVGGDATVVPHTHHLMLVVANGSRFGGGFHIAPGARNDDGALDLVRVGDAASWRRALLLGAALRGRHLGAREVSHVRATTVTFGFAEPPLFEADGELHRATSPHVVLRLHAGALRLAVPPR